MNPWGKGCGQGLTPSLHHVIDGMQPLQVDLRKVKAKEEINNVPPVVVVTPWILVGMFNSPTESSTVLYASHDFNRRMYDKIWRATKPTVVPQNSTNPTLITLPTKSEEIGNGDIAKMSVTPSHAVLSSNSLQQRAKVWQAKKQPFQEQKVEGEFRAALRKRIWINRNTKFQTLC